MLPAEVKELKRFWLLRKAEFLFVVSFNIEIEFLPSYQNSYVVMYSGSRHQ